MLKVEHVGGMGQFFVAAHYRFRWFDPSRCGRTLQRSFTVGRRSRSGYAVSRIFHILGGFHSALPSVETNAERQHGRHGGRRATGHQSCQIDVGEGIGVARRGGALDGVRHGVTEARLGQPDGIAGHRTRIFAVAFDVAHFGFQLKVFGVGLRLSGVKGVDLLLLTKAVDVARHCVRILVNRIKLPAWYWLVISGFVGSIAKLVLENVSR